MRNPVLCVLAVGYGNGRLTKRRIRSAIEIFFNAFGAPLPPRKPWTCTVCKVEGHTKATHAEYLQGRTDRMIKELGQKQGRSTDAEYLPKKMICPPYPRDLPTPCLFAKMKSILVPVLYPTCYIYVYIYFFDLKKN